MMLQSDTIGAANTTFRGTRRKRAALTPHRAEIEQWVREGRSDEWIATALGTSRSSVQSFRSRRGIRRRLDSTPPTQKTETARQEEEAVSVFEGVLEHGEEEGEGYGLWLDPAVADDSFFQKGFSRVSDVEVRIEESRIVLTPASGPSAGPDRDNGSEVSDEAGHQLEALFGRNGLEAAADSGPNTERGRVKWFHKDKNYGFILRPGGEDIFFHGSEIRDTDALDSGEEVSYEVGRNRRGLIATGLRSARA